MFWWITQTKHYQKSQTERKIQIADTCELLQMEKRYWHRPYLPLFAGIGIEKLYLFYTRVLNKLGGINFSDGERLRYPYYYDAFGNRHILYF